tara:strand:- start:199 stop:336 length:138 start_codon:yes stop_codon:yes gene_type:complete
VNVDNADLTTMISLMAKPDGLSEIATGKYRMIFGFNGKKKEMNST